MKVQVYQIYGQYADNRRIAETRTVLASAAFGKSALVIRIGIDPLMR